MFFVNILPQTGKGNCQKKLVIFGTLSQTPGPPPPPRQIWDAKFEEENNLPKTQPKLVEMEDT